MPVPFTEFSDDLGGTLGDDEIRGGSGDDYLRGSAGDDHLRGGGGDDTLNGGAGEDRLSGGSGDDSLHGGKGDDVLIGGDGDDFIEGGTGSGDRAMFRGSLADYSFSFDSRGFLVIGDSVADRDGTDTVNTVESFDFDGVLYTYAQIVDLANLPMP